MDRDTLREGLPQRRTAPPAPGTPSPGSAFTPSAPVASAERPAGERRGPRGPQPYSATLKARDDSPAFATTQLVLNPFTGEILARTGYADQSTGRKIRTWLRFLHTGQAFGIAGQLLAGLACITGCLLVYTGFALSWRRFFRRRTTMA